MRASYHFHKTQENREANLTPFHHFAQGQAFNKNKYHKHVNLIIKLHKLSKLSQYMIPLGDQKSKSNICNDYIYKKNLSLVKERNCKH